MRRVYADFNATTPLEPAVLEAMLPYLREHFGNASSVHRRGREARAAIDDARVRVARLIGAQESEIIFTGGGTEADNTAVFGVPAGHIITSGMEHHAVLHACQQRRDCEITYLPVSRECLVDPDDLRKAIRPDTRLVTLMSANNETGTIQPVQELAAICRQRGVPFHTDAVQSFGKMPVNVQEWGVDLLSLAAHKFYGPKGVGILYVRRGVKLKPLLWGGSHEYDRRAGTENVAGIVGLAKAAELAKPVELFDLTEKFAAGILARISGAYRNGHAKLRVGNTVNFSFEGCESDGLLLGLDLEGVEVSSGSACAVGSLEPSHVLTAMGLSRELARAAVRFSFGKGTQPEELDYVLDALVKVVTRLRQFSRKTGSER
jgi:cysteine desulfurase